MFVQIAILDKIDPNMEKVPEEEFPPIYQILVARLNTMKINYTKTAAFWLASLSDRPGIAVLYATVIAALAKKKNDGSAVTLKDLTAMEVFGWGVPTEEELHRIWDGQKVHDGKGPDNWLDRKEAWQ